jgi:hypothetical protein
MLLLASCWNEDGDMLGRVAWNAADVGELLKRMFLVVVRLLQQRASRFPTGRHGWSRLPQ